MHKAILFDLGRVLVHFDFARAYQAMAPLCAFPATEIAARLAPSGLVDRFETGLIEPAAFFDQFIRILDLRIEYPAFREIFNSIFTHELLPESLLESLARRYRLVLVSNTNAMHFETIRADFHHLIRHFHHLVLSYEVHAMKPRREIFDAAIARAGCAPGECFYADDIPQYVAAARALGIDAVQFESREQTEGAMRARGIEW
jgi:putative hydrolase of the HAD superfamily